MLGVQLVYGSYRENEIGTSISNSRADFSHFPLATSYDLIIREDQTLHFYFETNEKCG